MTVKQSRREWVTPDELAEELKVPLETVYRWRKSGTGPRGVRVGRHVRFDRVDVNTWLASRYDDAPAA